MKKIFVYEVRFDLSELIFKKIFTTYKVIKEKKDSYLVVNANEYYTSYKDVGIIFKKCPYIEYGYSSVQEEHTDNEHAYYSGFLYEDTDKDIAYKTQQVIDIVDETYKAQIEDFFRAVSKMKKEYETIITVVD